MLIRLLSVLILFLGVSVYCANDAPQFPTNVYLKIFLNQLNKIDGVEQSFSSDFYLTTFWEDSRVVGTYDPNVNWNPSLECVNVMGEATQTIANPFSELRGDTLTDDLFKLSTSGVHRENMTWIKSDQRFVGNFLTSLNLVDFPFDKQNAVVLVESALFNTEIVILLAYPSLVEGNVTANVLPKNFQVTEWKLLDVDPVDITNGTHYYKVFNESYSRFRMDINLARLPDYYMLKIVTGIILLVLMCIMVIALAVDEPDRMMGTLTVFLALVSFTFITGSDVPKVAYQTRIDIFITFSFFMTFFMMLQHSLNYLYREYLGEDDEHTSKVEVSEVMNKKGVTGVNRFLQKFKHRYSGVRTRKIDLIWAATVALVYAIGVIVIFGRPVADLAPELN